MDSSSRSRHRASAVLAGDESAPVEFFGAPITVGDPEFGRFRQLIEEGSGIHLADSKRALLAGRLAPRMRALAVTDHASYLECVLSDPAEMAAMLDVVTTNETRFFREPTQFEYLEGYFVPWLREEAERGRRRRQVRVWSAGCSTGEEVYSIAMLLCSALPPERGWELDIVGTDLSTRALAHANRAVWPSESLEQIPQRFHRFTLRGVRSRAGWIRMAPELQAMVRFTRVNLAQLDAQVEGPYDLVFCRNVLIYFRTERRERVVEQFLRRLQPDGLFLLGHSESLAGSSVAGLRGVGPMIYCRAEARWQRPQRTRQDNAGGR